MESFHVNHCNWCHDPSFTSFRNFSEIYLFIIRKCGERVTSFIGNARDWEYAIFFRKQSRAIEKEDEKVVDMADIEGSALKGEIVNGTRACLIKWYCVHDWKRLVVMEDLLDIKVVKRHVKNWFSDLADKFEALVATVGLLSTDSKWLAYFYTISSVLKLTGLEVWAYP